MSVVYHLTRQHRLALTQAVEVAVRLEAVDHQQHPVFRLRVHPVQHPRLSQHLSQNRTRAFPIRRVLRQRLHPVVIYRVGRLVQLLLVHQVEVEVQAVDQ